ncbi:MAG: 23S rRNA (adenine(2503)-C(2))-methyltransferase RlmN [Paraprevotella sp.]|jgi:23S rRNA (adenine2503-C2)-methyltransferase|nr:23S rRNA (adenine(2503)-C(2))-methyltransferase RlmN [Paraprevotella sp.]
MNEGTKISLLGMTLPELREVAKQMGMPAFTAKQMAEWLYRKQVTDIDGMTNISVKNRNLLKERYQVGCSAPVECQRSVDGTAKYLYRTSEGGYVETVYIPDADRATLCVSSQVGCRMNCRFCMTGKQGFAGHLSVTDILNQIYSLPEREHLTNIVFMGQGEPFDNLDNVLKATTILTADEGYAWSPKRITVSTVGLRKGLKRFLDESECHLAISLHNPFHEQRAMLMPAEKSYGLQEMIDLLKTYDFTHQRRLSFEYIMFDGVNDTMEHARELLRLLNGMECRMNLIRFHAIPNVDLKGSPDDQILKFRNYLTTHGLFSTIRASRGQDIYAACGLLSTAKQQNMNI